MKLYSLYPLCRLLRIDGLSRWIGSLLLVLLSGAHGLSAQPLLINEVQTSNGATVADEDGDYADWIELYNASGETVNLAGWALSDRPDNPAKWVMSGGELAAGERLLIWASGKDRSGPGPLHANFALSADGETLVLTRPDAVESDRIELPPIPRDVAYGRYPDGGNPWGYFLEPSPATANPAQANDIIWIGPQFSRPRGYHEAEFDLELSHPQADVRIVYTLDGSEPTASSGINYTGPIRIERSTVVRAGAFRAGAVSLKTVATATYLFLDEVIARPQTPAPPGFPSTWWASLGSNPHVSYGMSPAVMARSGYAERMKAALLDIPTVSLVAPISALFGSNGIYSNPTRLVDEHGEQWEKAASMEWIDPNSGESFGVGVGLRIQGAGSRGEDSTPKKSFRVLFKGEYGPGRLGVPVFSAANSLVSDHNTLIFRAEYNNTWLHWAAEQRVVPEFGMYLADQWLKDRQIAMSGWGSHGRKVHLFINGLYWGLYTMAERPDAAFAASYLGGEREEYDSLGWRGMRDGDWLRWRAEIESVITRDLTDNSNYLALQQYLDVDHFIDYNLIQMFAGNQDWPRNNWTAVRHREDGRVYHVTWDSERTLHNVNDNVVSKAWDPQRLVGDPPSFFRVLRNNAEFRLRFADRAQKHLFNGGELTPDVTVPDFARAAAQARTALFAEEARWGAYRKEIRERRAPSAYYGVDSHWDPAVARMLNEYLPQRTAVLIGQLRDVGLYSPVDAPLLSRHGGGFPPGEQLAVSGIEAGATAYYTTDGSDPRIFGSGAVAPVATAYTAPLQLNGRITFKARVLHNGEWSALTEAVFYPDSGTATLIPGGTADWVSAVNWDAGYYPDGTGVTARIRAPQPDVDRNVNIRTPLSIGKLEFLQGASIARNRVRDRDSGNTLTFADPSGVARLSVDGNGRGFVEFEVVAGVMLQTDLKLDVRNPLGDPEHGALRLRQGWFGPGGLIKTGPGVASLTGADKSFTGALEIREGVLQVTEPSMPRYASGVRVLQGGQLRLTSGSGSGDVRHYTFGGRMELEGNGVDSGLPAGEQRGLLGALRYDPGTQDNRAVLTNSLQLNGAAGIHIDGTRNTLELTGAVIGDYGISKSGGGRLLWSGNPAQFTGALTIANGRVELQRSLPVPVAIASSAVLAGSGQVGQLSGDGDVLVENGVLHASGAEGLFYSISVGGDGSTPEFVAPGWGRGLLRMDSAPLNAGAIALYLPDAASGGEAKVFRGGLFVPADADLATALQATPIRVYIDQSGSWILVTNATVAVVDQQLFTAAGLISGKTLEVSIPAGASGFDAWRIAQFADPADLQNPAISGLFATPRGDGVSNLERYAMGLNLVDAAELLRPRLQLENGVARFVFHRSQPRADVHYRVTVSPDLIDWQTVLFDSLTEPFPPQQADWIVIADSLHSVARFYRLELRLLP